MHFVKWSNFGEAYMLPAVFISNLIHSLKNLILSGENFVLQRGNRITDPCPILRELDFNMNLHSFLENQTIHH